MTTALLIVVIVLVLLLAVLLLRTRSRPIPASPPSDNAAITRTGPGVDGATRAGGPAGATGSTVGGDPEAGGPAGATADGATAAGGMSGPAGDGGHGVGAAGGDTVLGSVSGPVRAGDGEVPRRLAEEDLSQSRLEAAQNAAARIHHDPNSTLPTPKPKRSCPACVEGTSNIRSQRFSAAAAIIPAGGPMMSNAVAIASTAAIDG